MEHAREVCDWVLANLSEDAAALLEEMVPGAQRLELEGVAHLAVRIPAGNSAALMAFLEKLTDVSAPKLSVDEAADMLGLIEKAAKETRAIRKSMLSVDNAIAATSEWMREIGWRQDRPYYPEQLAATPLRHPYDRAAKKRKRKAAQAARARNRRK